MPPVAYNWDLFNGLLGTDNLEILAVKRDRRSHGAGTMLARNWFQEAMARDLMGFHGECAPKTSLGFWTKTIGCLKVPAPYGNRDVPWVAMPFRHTRNLPDDLQTIKLDFEIYDPDENLRAEWSFSTITAVIEAGDYMLAEDFVAYVPESDARLRVIESGRPLLVSKTRDVTEFGGQRKGPWVRIRDIMLE